jgi:hypothetical protein
MTTNMARNASTEDMTDSTFPQRFDLQISSNNSKVALPEFQEERDHVSELGSGDTAELCLGGLLNVAIEIATERRALLGAIKSALENRDHPEVLRLASKLCGAIDEKSGGANSGINGESGS